MLAGLLIATLVIVVISLLCALDSKDLIEGAVPTLILVLSVCCCMAIVVYGYSIPAKTYIKTTTSNYTEKLVLCKSYTFKVSDVCTVIKLRRTAKMIPIKNPVWESVNSTEERDQ